MLKKPLIAAILSVLIVLASTLVSVHARLDPLCKEYWDEFRSGDIHEALLQYCSCSAETLLLAKNYGVDVHEASDCAAALQKAMDKETLSGVYARYQRLNQALSGAKASLLRADLSEADRQALDRLDKALTAAQKKIADCDYNSRVAHFLRKELGSFSCFVARLCGVRLPEQFA